MDFVRCPDRRRLLRGYQIVFRIAGLIGIVVFVIATVCTLFVREANGTQRFIMAIVPAGIAFIAALSLMVRDLWQQKVVRRSIQRRLLSRSDIPDEEYQYSFFASKASLNRTVRRAIAEFFSVPTEKIYVTDQLLEDYQSHRFGPALLIFVVHYVARNEAEMGRVGQGAIVDRLASRLFASPEPHTVKELTTALQRALESMR